MPPDAYNSCCTCCLLQKKAMMRGLMTEKIVYGFVELIRMFDQRAVT